jgi:uncharacterized coiled-coil DUF342 family protein
MNNDDIVTRLRAVLHNDRSVELMNREAADEIERLRKDRDEAEPLLNELWERRTEATEMREEINRLRAERDEVRQSYCSLMEAYRGGDGRVTANKLGWGYLFEEDKPCQ